MDPTYRQSYEYRKLQYSNGVPFETLDPKPQKAKVRKPKSGIHATARSPVASYFTTCNLRR